MLKNFTPNNSMQEAISPTNRAAGSADVNGATLDFQGWLGSVTAVVEFGAIATDAVTSLKWQGSDDGTAWTNLVETSVSVPDDGDNDYYVMELYFPRFRYNRIVVDKDGSHNVTILSAQYVLAGPRKAVTSFPSNYNVHIAISPDYEV
jgi:hypothetical protein